MFKIKYSQEDNITPECCYIKDWNINLSCKDKNTISISYYNNTLYAIFDSIHDTNHRKNSNLSDYLELRLWTDKKIICLWTYNINNITDILYNIQEKLETADYISDKNHTPIEIDLSEYDIVFTTKEENNDIKVIKCSLEEFYNYPTFNILNNLYQRQYHILTPEQKESLKRSGKFKHYHKKYYDEANKKWNDKIGDMDIAQYHMLIYGE